jgi:hypothetical protein
MIEKTLIKGESTKSKRSVDPERSEGEKVKSKIKRYE